MSRAGRAPGCVTPVAARPGALALAALVVAVATACAPSSDAGSAVPTAAVASAADCLAPEVLGELGLTLDPGLAARASHTPAPTVGRMPGGFVPTGVLVCEVGGQMRDGAGTWTAVSATTREGSAADLASLVAALDRGSAAARADGAPATAASCAPEPHAVVLWLVDALGRAVRPRLAVDACGAPRPEVRAALARLAVTDVVDRPVELVTSGS